MRAGAALHPVECNKWCSVVPTQLQKHCNTGILAAFFPSWGENEVALTGS
jgi:hypothetical protein